MVRKQVSKNPTVLLIRISTVDPVVAHMCLGMSADTNHDSSDGLSGSTKCRMLLLTEYLSYLISMKILGINLFIEGKMMCLFVAN